MDGEPVKPGERIDEVTIGFGTAKVHGRFIREKVCLGAGGAAPKAQRGVCVRGSVVAATRLSPSPFDHFAFDGILGLGLPALALSNNFSVFDLLARSGQLKMPHFAFFLAGDSQGEESELAIGGHDPGRLLGPLSWVPLARPELGYWQVQLVGVHVDGRPLDLCRDGSCHGILDSGTSHLGVPRAQSELMDSLLTRPAAGASDCRLASGPTLVFELPRGVNLTLGPQDYMRRLPLAEDVPLRTGVIVPSVDAAQAEPPDAEAGPPGGVGPPSEAAAAARCTPKLLALDWPRPVGPNVFILGVPVMQRYYTVFDWKGLAAGFGLARHAEP